MPGWIRGISSELTGGFSLPGQPPNPSRGCFPAAGRSLPSSRRFPVSRSGAISLSPGIATTWRGSCASTHTVRCVAMAERTSLRARVALVALVAGYLAMAVVAGAPNSPLTVLLPHGATPPRWAHGLAIAADLADVTRRGLTTVALALLVLVLAAFAVVVL